MTTRAAIYCRISKDAEARGMGVARQERECRALALKEGWNVVAVYVDNDLSASNLKRPRPRYQEMLAAVEERQVDAIIARHDDRLHRHPREMEDFIDLVERTKIKVLLLDGFVDFTTAKGIKNARHDTAAAKYESDRKGERLRLMHEDIAAQGRWKGGPRPYGYRPPKGDRRGQLDVVPEEAEVIRAAAAQVLAGRSLYAICGDLNARGVPAAKGGGWRTPSMLRVLTAPMVAGRREFHGVDSEVKAVWDAILDEVTWRRVRAALDNGQPKRRGRPPTYLLTQGLARCTLCGSKMFAQRTTKKVRRYTCTKGPDHPGNCGHMTINAEPLEALVTEMVFAAVDTPALAAVTGAGPEDDTVTEGLAASVAEDEAQLLELADMWAKREMTRAGFLSARQTIETRIEEARRSMARQTKSRATDGFAGRPGALATAWPGMALDERRAVVSAVIDRVLIHPTPKKGRTFQPDRVEVIWKV